MILRQAVKTDLALSRKTKNQAGEKIELLLPDKGVQAWEYSAIEGKVKRTEHRHFDHQIDRDLEAARGFGEHPPGLAVGKKILLPVEEGVGGLDGERIRQHLGATVRGWLQPSYLGPSLTSRSYL